MKIPLITASALERLQQCSGSVALPQVRATSDAAERGTALHLFAERVLRGMSRDEALTHVQDEWKDTAAGFDPERAVGDLVKARRRPEVAFCLNVRTELATDLGSGLARGYPSPSLGDVFGTTDVLGIRGWDDRWTVVDWKCGSDVTACRDNLQIRVAARTVARLTGASHVEGRIGYVRSSGRVDVDKHIFDSFELDSFEEELSELYDRALNTAELAFHSPMLLPVLNPGSHCKYCPGLPVCPAQTSLARAMLPDLATLEGRLATLTDEEAGAAYVALRKIKGLVEVVDDALKIRARAGALPVDDDREVREISFLQRTFDRDRALSLLRELGATDAQLESCEPRERRHRVDIYKKPGAAKRKRKAAA